MRMSWVRFSVFLAVLFSGSVVAYFSSQTWIAVVWYVALFLVSFAFVKKEDVRAGAFFTSVLRNALKGFKLFPIFYVLIMATNLLFPSSTISVQEVSLNFVTVVVLVLIAPVVEEIAFRGYAQSFFRNRFHVNAAILISATFFAFFHSFEVFPQIFVMALFLSILRETTGSLIPGIVIHSLNNVLALVITALT